MNGTAARKRDGVTWTDYRTWGDRRRWEIIDGEAYDMTPAPATSHQHVAMELLVRMHASFRGGRCRLFAAPTDVKLSETDVVQPDLVVVCDPRQIRTTHVEGPPRLVVEILSPASVVHDRLRKMALYARAGIREVWLVTPYPALVEIFVLSGASYQLARSFEAKDILRSPTFPRLRIDLAPVFSFPIPREDRIRLVKEGRPPAYRVRRRPAMTR